MANVQNFDMAAGEARTLMLVSTTVVAHSSVEKVGSAAGVTVADADLKRGYLDVIRTYRLRSNAQRGVQLQLHPRVGLTWQIDVAGPTGPLQIGDTSVEVTLPATDQLQLHFRLWLRPDVVAGSYPLPVHLMALAI